MSAKAQNKQIQISGKVINFQNEKPLTAASVSLQNANDSSFIKKTYTDEKGHFSFQISNEKKVLLHITLVGYTPFSLAFKISPKQSKIAIGKIPLMPKSHQLETVTIKAKKKMYQFSKDSTVFNVPEGFETGGNAKDVLQYTPSLSIDFNNKITVKGQGNVGVYVDSKPISELGVSATEYLENTPAFMIAKVKILNEPPDPEDAAKAKAAGITDRYYINIITRKIKYRGYTAAITAGLNSRNEKTARMHFNMNMKPFQLNYSNNLRGRTDSSYRHRISFLKHGDSSVLDQKSYRKRLSFNQRLNAKYKFQFTEKEQLRLRARFNWNTRKNKGNDLSNILNPKHTPNQDRIQMNEARPHGYGFSGNADYKKKYEKQGKELSASINFKQRSNKKRHQSLGIYSIKDDSLFQKNTGNSRRHGLHANIQYKNTFNGDKKHFYIIGSSFSRNQRHNLNKVSRSDTTIASNQLFLNKRLSSNAFNTNSNLNSYILLGKRDKKFGWLTGGIISYNFRKNHDDYRGSRVKNKQLSARTGAGINYSPTEKQTITIRFTPKIENYQQKVVPNDSSEEIPYQYFNFIPAASLKYEWRNHQISFHYDRKNKQPSWRQLNPYVNNRDPLNIKTGNPDLRPEITDQYKIRYKYTHNSIYVSLNLKNDQTKDVISSYTSVDSSGVSTRTYVNLNKRLKRSANLHAGYHYMRNWTDLNLRVNINTDGGLSAYQQKSNDKHISKDLRNVSGITENFKVWTSIKYRFLSLIINGRYNGPRYFSQGKRPAHFRSGFRTRATLLNHSLTLTFGIENLFGASVKDNFYKTDHYIQHSSNRRDIRYFSFYLTYKFKNYKKKGTEK